MKRKIEGDPMQIWKMIVVSLVVASIVSVVAFSVAKSPSLSPALGGSAFVNAHSCDADGTCEADSLLVDRDGVFIDGKVISTGEGGSSRLVLDSATNWVGVNANLDVAEDILVRGKLLNASLDCDVFPIERSNGDRTCVSNGYDYCLIAEFTETTFYHDLNGSCTGAVQTKIESAYLDKCPTRPFGGSASCRFNNGGVEPYYGDIQVQTSSSDEVDVVCCSPR